MEVGLFPRDVWQMTRAFAAANRPGRPILGTLMKLVLLPLLAATLAHAAALIVPESHPDYFPYLNGAAFAGTLPPAALATQFPQKLFFEYAAGPVNLIAYFDPINPARQPIVTTPAPPPFVYPELPAIPTPAIEPTPILVPPAPVPVSVPEPRSLPLVGGSLMMLYFLWWRGRGLGL